MSKRPRDKLIRHWVWSRCPKSLYGGYQKGTQEHPTVVYECACDEDLRIWHCNFALPGACNDINVPYLLVSAWIVKLNFVERLFCAHVHFTIFPSQVDGIYPDWSCFMGPTSKPVSAREKHYTVMQAARRKDIERAFGALKIKLNILNVPRMIQQMLL